MKDRIKAKQTIKSLSRQTLLAAGVLLGAAIVLNSCSRDEEFDPAADERVPVAFQTHIAGAQATTNARTRGNVTVTSRGTTAAGLAYIEYIATDGFLTREVMPPVPGKNTLQTRTAAGGSEWTTGDAVGIFMLSNGGTLPGDIVMGADNTEYHATPGTPPSQATFAPANVSETIYYPQAGTADFIAYYPYGGTGTAAGQVTDAYIYKVSVADQSTPAAIDVLYSNNATNKARSETDPVELGFNHALCKLVINIKAGDGMAATDFGGITASLKGFPTTADFALANGTTFTNPGGTATDIVPLKWGAPSDPLYKTTYEAILIPQPDGGTSRTAVFTVGGRPYTWTIGDGITFTQGKVHTYEITINKNGIAVAGDPEITKWTGIESSTPGTAEEIGKGIAKVFIPAGTFLMGSSDGSNHPSYTGGDPELNTTPAEPERQSGAYIDEVQHKVTLTQDFWMGKYEVTNAQYAAFLNANNIGQDGIWAGAAEYSDEVLIKDSSNNEGDTTNRGLNWVGGKWVPSLRDGIDHSNYPVVHVTWYGASEYARWVGGSVPTEAQWEYACRGGQTESLPFGIGDGKKLYGNMANFDGRRPYELPAGHIDNYDGLGTYPNTYLNKTTEVGSYPYANGYGLYDMHGNVFEWCYDDLPAYTSSMPVTDPRGNVPQQSGYHAVRGGSYGNYGWAVRTARRNEMPAYTAGPSFGFRVVFTP